MENEPLLPCRCCQEKPPPEKKKRAEGQDEEDEPEEEADTEAELAAEDENRALIAEILVRRNRGKTSHDTPR